MPPQLFVGVEHGSCAAHGRKVGGDDLLAPPTALRNEGCALQYRNVLLHRREAHCVSLREGAHALFRVDDARDDVAARAVGECAKKRVDLVVGESIHLYNHLVAR